MKDHKSAIDQLPNNIDINAVLKFLEDTGNINVRRPLEKKLAKYTLKHGNTLKPLLIKYDGFDEIKGDRAKDQGKNKVSKLLKFLKDNTQASILVTAREHETNILQDSLSVFDIKFEPLEEPKQKALLKEYWKNYLRWSFSKDYLDNQLFSDSPNAKFKIYVEQLLKMMNTVLMQQNTKFMGIPLTLRLLAESYQDKFKKFITNDNDLSEDFNNLNMLTRILHEI
ncbi:hypothetical protein [Rickettsia endosymbiont of Polydrusus tereticollis]|uniref:hypothetical protein n=1 Tax=Rickettsia endosymbiont of Polydrusus tereticollis TaxID=3066251 RepID=UPI003132AD5E